MFFSCDKVKNNYEIESPNGQIKTLFYVTEAGIPTYKVYKIDTLILNESILGVQMEHASFSSQLTIEEASKLEMFNELYKPHHGKQSKVDYKANEQTFQLKNAERQRLGIQFRVSGT